MMTRLISKVKIVLIILTIASLPFLSVTANAQNSAAATARSIKEEVKKEREERIKALEEAKTERGAQQLAKAQELAGKLISERLRLIEKLNETGNTQKCRTAAKAEVATALTAVQDRLNDQKASIVTLTTVSQIRSLIKDGIVGKNHVFVAVLPAVRGMCVSDKIISLLDGKLAAEVSALELQGADTTELKQAIADARTNAQAAYDGYKEALQNPGNTTYKSDLENAKTRLKDAKTNLAEVRTILGKLKGEDESNDN